MEESTQFIPSILIIIAFVFLVYLYLRPKKNKSSDVISVHSIKKSEEQKITIEDKIYSQTKRTADNTQIIANILIIYLICSLIAFFILLTF